MDEEGAAHTSRTPQSKNTYRGSEVAFDEELLLEDFESYWEEVNARLTILGIVNGSIIKGIVEEASEKIASARMQQTEECNQTEAANIGDRNLFLQTLDEFGKKLYEQLSYMNTFYKNWQRKVSELSNMREELDSISKSLLSHDVLYSYNSIDSLDECDGNKKKDNLSRETLGSRRGSSASLSEEIDANSTDGSEVSEGNTSDVAYSPQSASMSKEDLVTHYENELMKLKRQHKSEMIKFKRQHESALQEKTEELFSLKREYFKDKGSTPLHLKRDKVIEHLRKKIPELTSKLDNVLFENGKPLSVRNVEDTLHHFKEKIDALLSESKQLQLFLTDKRKEIRCLDVEVLDAAKNVSFHSSYEAECLTKDARIEAATRDEVQKYILSELIGEYKNEMERSKLEAMFTEDTYNHVWKDIVHDAISNMKPIIEKCYEEKDVIASLLSEKEKVLSLEIEEKEKLKLDYDQLSKLVNEKEKVASEMESTLLRQKEQSDLACEELNMLRYKEVNQEILISQSKREADMLRTRLDETLEKVHQYEAEFTAQNENIQFISESLEEAQKHKALLQNVIQEKEASLSVASAKENEQLKQLHSIAGSIKELSKVVARYESRVTNKVERNSLRLDNLYGGCNHIMQQANMLKRKELWYRQAFERRSSDLQKAETEVDLLGDEVDVLTKLLERIYIALDFYSPVLQHYPGVMEVLKLIQREVRG